MTMTVLFLITSSIASCISFSDSESSDDVASSRTRILVLASIALAIATLCLSPHESLIQRSPTSVSYPLFNHNMKPWHLAIFAAAMISSSVAVGFA
jgi:hypothetical protein